MADLIDKHIDLKRRVRKLEQEVAVRPGENSFHALANHAAVIAEHLCHATGMQGVPFGRLAALLFRAEQDEQDLDLLRLLRVERERVGTLPWIGNAGSFRSVNVEATPNGEIFNGSKAKPRGPSAVSYVRQGQWIYPVILPVSFDVPRSTFGQNERNEWYGGGQYRSPCFILSNTGESGGASLTWTAAPDGAVFPDGTVVPADSFVLTNGLVDPPAPVMFGAGITGANHIFFYPAPRNGYGYVDSEETGTLIAPPVLPLQLDIGPPRGGGVVGRSSGPFKRKSFDPATDQNARGNDPQPGGLNPCIVEDCGREVFIRGPVYHETEVFVNGQFTNVKKYADEGIHGEGLYMRFSSDDLRSAGPPIEYTSSIFTESLNMMGHNTSPYHKDYAVPSFDDVVVAVIARLSEGTPDKLLNWYNDLLGSSARDTAADAGTYPGTSFPADADTYQHLWTPIKSDDTGYVWMLERHGWLHLKGWMAQNAGLIHLDKKYLPDVDPNATYLYPLTAADGSRTWLQVAFPDPPDSDTFTLRLNNAGNALYPYYVDGIRWPLK